MTVSFLLKQMRIEIERIPQEKKQALLEAQQKSRAEEFSDGRLEQFLRFEGMNPKVSIDLVRAYINQRVTTRRLTCNHLCLVALVGRTTLCKLLGKSPGSVWAGEISVANDAERSDA
jgi:hypothetical protein